MKAKIHIEINPILPKCDVAGQEGFALAHDTFRTLLDTELSKYKLPIADEALLEDQRQQWKHFLDGLDSYVTNKHLMQVI